MLSLGDTSKQLKYDCWITAQGKTSTFDLNDSNLIEANAWESESDKCILLPQPCNKEH